MGTSWDKYFVQRKGNLKVNKDYIVLNSIMSAMPDTAAMEQERTASENQVIPYEAPWNIFAVAFSNNPMYPFRMGVASFLAETTNYVEIIQLNEQRTFQKKVSFEHNYPPTKILFNPD